VGKVAKIAAAAERVSKEILEENFESVGPFPAAPIVVMCDLPELLVLLAACTVCTAHRITLETLQGIDPDPSESVIGKSTLSAALDLIASAGFDRGLLEDALQNFADEGVIVDGETRFPQWVIGVGVCATPGEDVTPTFCAFAPWAGDLVLEYFSRPRSKRVIAAGKVDGVRSAVEKCFTHEAPAREFLAMVERCARLEGRG